jgi:hypothetical protein
VEEDQVVWTDEMDGGAYVAKVVHTEMPYYGKLTLTETATGKVLVDETVVLAFDARDGADEDDVLEWKRICEESAPPL